MRGLARHAMRSVVVLAVLLPACSTVLGLREIDEGAGSPDGSSSDGAGPIGEEAGPTDGSSGEASVDAGVDASGRCGSTYPNGLLCDDFETGDISPKWRKVYAGGSGEVRTNKLDAAANRNELHLGFDPHPATGKAVLAYEVPLGRRSIRFTANIPNDAYPTGLPIASIVDATDEGVRLLLSVTGSTLSLQAKDSRGGTATTPLTVVPDQPTCIEMELDGAGNLKLWKGTTLSTGSATTTTANGATSAEVGLRWTFGAGPESVVVKYDDVIVGTGAVGCPP